MRFCIKAAALIVAMAVLCLNVATAGAVGFDNLSPGEYAVNASLSCYINAMGGVEFGAPLLTNATVSVDAQGSKEMTLYFTKSQVTIYSVTCDTFIDNAEGSLGYYDAVGNLVLDNVRYTLSGDTALNSRQEEVNYVSSMTFPLGFEADTYYLSLYINSNVMGTQFSNDKYPAILSVDWNIEAEELTQEAQSGALSADNNSEQVSEQTSDVTASTSTESLESIPQTTVVAESMAGLNVYYAGQEQTEAQPLNQASEVSSYIAYFNIYVLVAVGAVAFMMIVAGVILMIKSRKGNSNEKN